MANISRVTPISISPTDPMTASSYKDHIIQTISMGVRIGQNVSIAIGGMQSFGWRVERPVTELYQIEPLVDGTFSSAIQLTSNPGLFKSAYWPGEVIELIPGKQGPASLSLSRCVFFGSNLLSALMYIEKAGTEEAGAFAIPEASKFQPSKDESSKNFSQYVSLIQQVRPIFIKQFFTNPVDGTLAYGRVFEDVYIESMSEETVDAQSNKPMIESIEAKATRIRPLVAPTVAPKKR